MGDWGSIPHWNATQNWGPADSKWLLRCLPPFFKEDGETFGKTQKERKLRLKW